MQKKKLVALALAGTALATAGFLYEHNKEPHKQKDYFSQQEREKQPLPPSYTTAASKYASLVSMQPAARICPEEVVILKGEFQVSGSSKTRTVALNMPAADANAATFYGFFVPGAMAKQFNTEVRQGPVNVTIDNISPKEANACAATGGPVYGRIASFTRARPQS